MKASDAARVVPKIGGSGYAVFLTSRPGIAAEAGGDRSLRDGFGSVARYPRYGRMSVRKSFCQPRLRHRIENEATENPR